MVKKLNLLKATQVLIVEHIEPILSFWSSLGLEPVVEIPDPASADGRLGFVILAGPGLEIMYQTLGSHKQDLVRSSSYPDRVVEAGQQGILFIEVSRLDEVQAKLIRHSVVIPRRTTSYGLVEIGYADPAGNLVVFAENPATSAEA